MPEPLLQAEGVGVHRGARRVLRAVDLRLAPGEIVAVLGPNGAGKSTLLKALAGLLPHEGSVRLGSAPLSALSARERARRLAYVPQRSLLRAPLRVEEVVSLGRYAHGRADPDAVKRALVDAGAADLAGRTFSELSVGETQRVLIARALATEAPLLLLDEPTASLDAGQALAALGRLRCLAEAGKGVLLVLHHLDDALCFADRCLLLDHGEVVGDGAPGEVIRAEPIRAVYGVGFRAEGLRFHRLEEDG